MRLIGRIGLLIILVCAVLAAPEARADSYSVKDIRFQARALARQLKLPSGRIADLMDNLEGGLQNSWFQEQIKTRSVNGVFIFRGGEGGFILGRASGDGLISFAGNIQGAPIAWESESVGLQASSQKVWGVGLVVDLNVFSDFGGLYEGKTQGATASDMTTYNWVVLSKARDEGGAKAHNLFLIRTGEGWAVSVAAERMRITPRW